MWAVVEGGCSLAALTRPSCAGALDGLRPLGLRQIAMTTNGVALSRLLPSLHAAGLDKLNLSLDTLQRDRFLELTRRDALPKKSGGGCRQNWRPLHENSTNKSPSPKQYATRPMHVARPMHRFPPALSR